MSTQQQICENIKGAYYSYYNATVSPSALTNYCSHGGNTNSPNSYYNAPNCCDFDTIQVWMIVIMSVLGPAVVIGALFIATQSCIKQRKINLKRESEAAAN